MKKERVSDWMTTDVATISPKATLPDAHQLMTKEQVRRLPVVDANGRLVGIITRGDVRGAQPSPATSLTIWELNYLLSKLAVEKVMTSNPVTITEDATIAEAAQLMLENRISGLPVLNKENKLVGIITESDIFSMIVVHEWNTDQDEKAFA